MIFQPFSEQNTCIMPCGKDHVNGNPFLVLFCFVWAKPQATDVVNEEEKGIQTYTVVNRATILK